MSLYKISSLCPLRFHQVGTGDFAFNQIPSFEYLAGYNQIYFHGDSPGIQVLSTDSGAVIRLSLVDIYGVEVSGWEAIKTASDCNYYTYECYHFMNSLPSVSIAPTGIYILKMVITDTQGNSTFYSEPLYLCASKSDTVQITFNHDENDFDRKFVNAPVTPSMIRIEGGMKSDGFQPGGKFTMFQDIDYNSVMLNSQPYNIEKWTFGGSRGIPGHLADKLNRIFALSDVKIDGVQYSRNEGAKLERNGETDYPLAGWSIDLVKSENPFSDEFYTVFLPLTCDNSVITVDSTLISCDQTQY